jgi:GNAT superfamily N-acetyltransferase
MPFSLVNEHVCIRRLMDLDYQNTRALMESRFSRQDLKNFIDLWYCRNFGASVCIEHCGTILGFAIVYENKLEYLVVSEDCEGLGYGRILVKYVIKFLQAQGYNSACLITANDPTLRYWYARLGFELSSSSRDAEGIRGDCMVLRFRPKRSAGRSAGR